MEFKNPFTSKRERVVERDDAAEPTPFQVVGGWGEVDEGRYRPDPAEAELTARQAGVEVAAALEQQRLERLRAARAELPASTLGRDQDPRWRAPGDR